MTTQTKQTIEIPLPLFHLHELVTLHWNGEFNTRIVGRSYDLDRQEWNYRVAGRNDSYGDVMLERRQ